MRKLTESARLHLFGAAIGLFLAACSASEPAEPAASQTEYASLNQTSGDIQKADPVDVALTWKYGMPVTAASVTRGGAGGEVIRVTSLNSEGPGTLRAALQQSGPRVIVFEVAGVIDLGGQNISINEPFVSIAGQTAPSPGITLIKGGLIIRTHDVIVQHVRIRPGDLGEAPRSGRDIDAITTISAYNVVVDHCSLSWATDENLSASGPRFTGDTPDEWRKGTSHNIFYSQNIIAEGLAHSTHAKGEHSKGSLIHDNVSELVIYANLYAHNFERSPLFKGGVQGSVINNMIYNPGQRAVHYNLQGIEWAGVPPVLGRMDLIGNAMRAGPSTEENLPLLMIAGVGDLSAHIAGNTAIDRWGNPLPLLGRYTSNVSEIIQSKAPNFDHSALNIMPASQVESYILANAGARPWDRDQHDVRVLADTAEGRGQIIDTQDQVGGYPNSPEYRLEFDETDWDLDLLAPFNDTILDNRAGAKGT